ncbi:MAG: hypothetical protein GY760_14295 [Deltaproteobacteria bacterium]|nr:hypothetical protein [Deltaproteobacteria bacterium]
MKTEILYCGKKVIVSCDKKCNKAWGRNGLSYDKKDNPIIPKVDAPEDPGTYEGGVGKPTGNFSEHNKWCVRECEKSKIKDL